jgi:hypothetical protein
MKMFILLLLILFASSVAFTQAEYRPDIGDVLKKEYIPKKPKEMAALCCFYPFIEKFFGGVKYTIAFERDTREIIYLSTWDKNFKTEDGYRVGDYIQASFYQPSSSGFNIYAPKNSDGWYPVVGYTLSLPNENGVWENLNPFEGVKPNTVLTLKILSFEKH